jgi:steroid delta-isomerase-like uncharacterized protein
MTHQADKKTIVREFIEDVWNQGNADAVPRFVAPAYTIRHDPGDPQDGQSLDLDGYAERLARSRGPFPDQRFEIVELIGEGEAMVMTWKWTGTHLAALPGFPATGRQITMTGSTVYYFDGKFLIGHWQVVDRLSVFQQLQHGQRSA